MFADDLKIFRTVSCDQDAEKLQLCLDKLFDWCSRNDITLNINKCKAITFSRSKNQLSHNYKLNDVILDKVSEIRDLGVIFDSKMNFDAHRNYVVNKASQMLGFLKRTSAEFKSPTTLRTLYLLLVRPKLMYASPIWYPTGQIHIKQIETVQHKFFRILAPRAGLPDPYIDHTYTSLSTFSHIPSLASLRVSCDLKFLYKLVNGITDCSMLRNELCYIVPRRNMRSNPIFHLEFFRADYTKNNVLTRVCAFVNEMNLDLRFVNWQEVYQVIDNLILKYE